MGEIAVAASSPSPSMFPGAASGKYDPADRNRAIRYWRPGERTPQILRFAVVLLVVCAVGLVLSGFLMWTADPPQPTDADQQRTIDSVATALRWVGSGQIIAAIYLCIAAPGILRGNARRRVHTLVAVGVAILISLGSWVIGVGGLVQPILALLLASAALAMYRPAVKTYFEQPIESVR